MRETVIKRTDTPIEPGTVATPRRLSPFKNDGRSPRDEVDKGDITHPLHNRRSRRTMGVWRGRLRLGGVALQRHEMPWKPAETADNHEETTP